MNRPLDYILSFCIGVGWPVAHFIGGGIVLQTHNGPGLRLGVSGLLGNALFYLCSIVITSISEPPHSGTSVSNSCPWDPRAVPSRSISFGHSS